MNRAVKNYNGICRFAILFQGRTGSSYFIESLNAHPNISAYGEELVIIKDDKDLTEDQKKFKQLLWFMDLMTKPLPELIKAIGFKTKLNDIIDKDSFAKMLNVSNTKIIQMIRKNKVKLAISAINSFRLYKKTGEWNLINEKDRLGSFHLDLERFENCLNFVEQSDEFLENYVNSLDLPVLRLYYEDLLADEDEFNRRTYEFLGVPAVETKGKLLKNTSNDLREVIDNFDELLERYAGTPYESMFVS